MSYSGTTTCLETSPALGRVGIYCISRKSCYYKYDDGGADGGRGACGGRESAGHYNLDCTVASLAILLILMHMLATHNMKNQ